MYPSITEKLTESASNNDLIDFDLLTVPKIIKAILTCFRQGDRRYERAFRSLIEAYQAYALSLNGESRDAIRYALSEYISECETRIELENDPEAMTSLGWMYAFGLGVKKDESRAVELYRQAAELKHPAAINNLGWMYAFGKGVEKNKVRAVELFEEAVALIHPAAMNNLAYMYKEGWGVKENKFDARIRFQCAAKLGDPDAIYSLALIYKEGRLVEKNEEVVIKYFEQLDKLGYPAAMSHLGHMYEKGQWVEKDIATAVKYYQRAAKLGFPAAMLQLAKMYEDGIGVKQNIKLAFKLYQQAANLQSVMAMKKVSNMYKTGQGVARNPRKEAYWLFKAAYLGDSKASVDFGMSVIGRKAGKFYKYYNLFLEPPGTGPFNFENKVLLANDAAILELLKEDREYQIAWLEQCLDWFEDPKQQAAAFEVLESEIFSFPKSPLARFEMDFITALFALWKYVTNSDNSTMELIDVLFNRILDLLTDQLFQMSCNLASFRNEQLTELMDYCEEVFEVLKNTQQLLKFIVPETEKEKNEIIEEEKAIDEKLVKIADILSTLINQYYSNTHSDSEPTKSISIPAPLKVHAIILIATLFSNAKQPYELNMSVEAISWLELTELAKAFQFWLDASAEEQTEPLTFLSDEWHAKLKKIDMQEEGDETTDIEEFDDEMAKGKKPVDSEGTDSLPTTGKKGSIWKFFPTFSRSTAAPSPTNTKSSFVQRWFGR